MKKGLLFLLLLSQIAIGQINSGTTKSGKYQMNVPDLGAKKDSAVVWDGTSKLLKILPISAFSTVTPDATATVKGKIKLAGDLGGTADLPTTPTAIHKTGDEEKNGSLKVTSSGAPALYGMHNGGGTGVLGYSISGDGLRAISASGIGLRVQNANGNTSNLAEFGILSTVSKIDYLGNITGKSFVKTGGNNSQILMADGNTVQIETLELVTNKQNSLSFDASNEKYPTVTAVRAADANNVKTSGNQSISGQKYFSNGLGKQITLLNTSNNAVLQIDNDSATTSNALQINPKSNSVGINVTSSVGQSGVKFISFMDNLTEVFKVEQDGKVTANSFVKSGGTVNQFLKADGSIDSNVYASLSSPNFTGVPTTPTAAVGTNTTQIATTAFVLANSPVTPDAMATVKGKIKLAGDLGGTADLPTTPTALHKSGNESFTGIKSATNTGGTSANGIDLINNGSGSTSVLRVSSTGTGTGMSITNTNTSSGFGLLLDNLGNGNGIFMNNTNNGTGHTISNSSTGTGISINNGGAGYGINLLNNNNGGTGAYIVNTGTGKGISVNNGNNGFGILVSNTGSVGKGLHVSNNSAYGNGIYVNNPNTGSGVEIQNISGGKGIDIGNSGVGSVGISITHGSTTTSSGSALVINAGGSVANGLAIDSRNQGNPTFTVDKNGKTTASGTITAAAAVLSNELVQFGQVSYTADIDVAGTLTANALFNNYISQATASVNMNLPEASVNKGKSIFFLNASAFTIRLLAFGGNPQIWTDGTSATLKDLTTKTQIKLLSDGRVWIVQ